jgi:transcriptional regulator with XRE-family HTH domain
VNPIQATPANKTPLDFVLWSRGISNKDFAKRLGVDPSYVSKFRKGLEPTERIQKKICRVLDLTTAELGWSDE